MKKPKKAKLTTFEVKLLNEFLMSQPTRVGLRKSENQGFLDLPLFNHVEKQTRLFD
ncbi:hypothetical protein [Larkinella terrae]|uniref:Uncharacterized protein n=1 Tax=Larkinella terrae TaxID=2025311 RepID=A0A7K0EJF3_9BACT|nr:hypothetical protein [Larkinella terrae]MRS61895.1 hypothetical protein [Larkinella terrae]